MSDFDLVNDQTQPVPVSSSDSDYATVPTTNDLDTNNNQTPGPLRTAILSAASAPDTPVDTIASLQEQTLQATKATIQSQQEFSKRIKIALDQQQKSMKVLNNLSTTNESLQSPETQKAIDDGYNAISAQDINDNARVSAETETIRRVQDYLTQGDPVSAKLTYNLLVNGGSNGEFDRAATKNMLLAQALERFQQEQGSEGWGHWLLNMAYGIIPTSYNFARSGDVPGYNPGTGTTLKNFFMSGSSLSNQSDFLYDKYLDPKDLQAALAPGGELEALIRKNSTTLGTFDPGTAVDILKGLTFQNDSDKAWANTWGIADPLLTFAPEFKTPWKIGTSIVGTVARLGARDAAKKIAAQGIEDIVRVGENAGGRVGLDRAGAEAELATSAMNPTKATDNAIPMGVDIDTHLKAAAEVLEKKLPENIQTVRSLSPEQQQMWFDQSLKAEERRIGQPIKDYKFMVEDVRSGDSWQFDANKIREQGNVVGYVEYTVGKKAGGGFATRRSAVSAAKARGLADNNVIFDAVENEWKAADPEFSLTGYHGTSESFDQFDLSRGGSITGADSAKEGLFFVSDPDVAWTYAIKSAETKSMSLDEVRQASARMMAARGTADEAAAKAAYRAVAKDTSISGQNIRPSKIKMTNPYIYDFEGDLASGFEDKSYTALIKKAKADGHDGVIFKNTNDSFGPNPRMSNNLPVTDDQIQSFRKHDLYVVFDPENVKAPWDAMKIERDVSGQWFVKARVNVKETGFATPPLQTPTNGLLRRLVRSSARTLDREAQMKAVASGSNADRFYASLSKMTKDVLKGVNKKQKTYLDSIIRKGKNQRMWYTDREFSMLYERLTGDSDVPQKVADAYKSYRLINDMEYLLRNDETYKNLVIRGAETVGFDYGMGEGRYTGTAFIRDSKPTARVWNVSDQVHYNELLSDADWERMSGQGYIHVEVSNAVALPDGTTVRNFLVKRTDLERNPLEKSQLAYSAGGHTMYTDKWFAKQATEGLQADTGKSFLKNPNVFRTGGNKNRLAEWSETMNRAIEVAKKGERDPQVFEDDIFAHASPELRFPSGEEFLNAVDRGEINLKNPIEVVYDRELPSRYSSAGPDVDRFVDVEETAPTGYYRTTGRMYDSPKGEHLLDESGEFADTIDPWDTQNTALFNISRMSSLSNYKTSTLERFKNTYGNVLNVRNLDEASPVDLLAAKPRYGTPAELVSKIKAEQFGISRILGFETDWDRGVRSAYREVADWVLGDATGGVRQTGHDFVYWLGKNNPVGFLRGLAFDAKLGMFNIGQFFLQTSTIAATSALYPKGAVRAIGSMIPTFSYIMSNGSEAVLDTLSKRIWKTTGFASEGEFKDYMRFINRTGFMNVGNTHLMVNSFGPSATFGASSLIEGIREKGRAFFFMGEQFNRAVAGRIAYDSLREQGLEVGTAAFRERFIGMADDLTMNMTNESAARFQHGFASIPTQFWAYNMRMMDAMFDNGFTPAQRRRLIVSQFLLYGAGGVPVVDVLANWWERGDNAKPIDISTVIGTLDRGIVDRAIYETFGADVQFGERVGTGAFLTQLFKDVTNQSEYGEKSAADVLGGATFSIGKQTVPILRDIVYYTYAETGGDQGWTITKDNLLKLAMQVSTLSNVTKAMLASNYGIYKSNSGTIAATDLPKADTFWIALGMVPQKVEDASIMNSYVQDQKTTISEAARTLRNWRQEAFYNPDKYEENKQKANMFTKLLPVNIKNQVLKQVNSTTDNSFYEFVERKYQKQKAQEGATTTEDTITNGQ